GERLIAVAQVDGHPERRLGEACVRPTAVLDGHGHTREHIGVSLRRHRRWGLAVPGNGHGFVLRWVVFRPARGTPRRGAGPIRPRRGGEGEASAWDETITAPQAS